MPTVILKREYSYSRLSGLGEKIAFADLQDILKIKYCKRA